MSLIWGFDNIITITISVQRADQDKEKKINIMFFVSSCRKVSVSLDFLQLYFQVIYISGVYPGFSFLYHLSVIFVIF